MNSTSPSDIPGTADAIVVGNGALGLSLAVELARSSLSVVVIGRSSRPHAASTAAGAMLGCFGEVTAPQMASPHGYERFALDLAARDAWPEWIDFLTDRSADTEPIISATGTTVILNTVGTQEVDSANFAAIESALKDHEEPHESVDPADVEWLDPAPNSRALKAIHIPGEHAVNAEVLLARLENAARSLGVVFVEDQAKSLDLDGERIRGVVLDSGESLSADTVVVAAGAHSQDLIDTVPQIKDRIPRVLAGHGVSLLLKVTQGRVPASVIRTPNRAFACGLHVVPRNTSTLYIGATNMIKVAPEDEAELRDVETLIKRSQEQLRRWLYYGYLLKVQTGNRPVTLDGSPLIGETSVAGLWLLTGTYRDGLFMSPALAQDLAARITGGSGTLDISAFTPERKPLQLAEREEVLRITLDQMMAVGYEEPWHINVFWDDSIRRRLMREHADWLDELDDQFTPPPEILTASLGNERVRDWVRAYYAAVRDASDL